MDLFGGWASPLPGNTQVPPSPVALHDNRDDNNDNLPEEAAFADSAALAVQENAWAQNRCLLCLLYEEKLRVLQRQNDKLEEKLTKAQSGVSNDGINTAAASSSSSSTPGKRRGEGPHVTTSTIVPDQATFLKLIADKDTTIEERERDLRHVSIDRDNLRAALDDSQLKIDALMHRLKRMELIEERRRQGIPEDDLEKGIDDEIDHLLETERQLLESGGGVSPGRSARRKHQQYKNVKLGAEERLRPLHTEDALGLSGVNNNNLDSTAPPHHHHLDDESSGGVTPVSNSAVYQRALQLAQSPGTSTIAAGATPHHHSNTNSNNAAAAHHSGADGGDYTRWSLRDFEHLGPNSRSSAHRRRSNSPAHRRPDGKLTRDVADDELGFAADATLPDVPSSAGRLRFPAANSLRDPAIAAPSEATWRRGGRAPQRVDVAASETPLPKNALDEKGLLKSPHFGAFGPN